AVVELGHAHTGGLPLAGRQLAPVVGGLAHLAGRARHLGAEHPDLGGVASLALGDVDAGHTAATLRSAGMGLLEGRRALRRHDLARRRCLGRPRLRHGDVGGGTTPRLNWLPPRAPRRNTQNSTSASAPRALLMSPRLMTASLGHPN